MCIRDRDQVADGRHIDSGVEHVDRDGDKREVPVLEIVQRLGGALHLTVDHSGEPPALQVRVESIGALVVLDGMLVGVGKDVRLGGQRADRVLDRVVHELADDGVVGATIRHAAFEVRALE